MLSSWHRRFARRSRRPAIATHVARVDAAGTASLALREVKKFRRSPMLRAEDNRFLTESGTGTPMGELLRRFWLPVLLSEELPEADGEPKKIIVMGEELLAFRDSRGVVGVIDQYCPHRGA